MRESTVLASTLLALGSRPDMRAWRQQSGVFAPLSARATCPACHTTGPVSRFNTAPVARVGVNGLSDIFVLTLGGRAVFVECKSDDGRQSEAQRNFQATVERFGARYIVARSATDALSQLGLYP